MPKSKQQNLRFRVIERLLKMQKGYTIEELLEHVNIALRDKGKLEVTLRTIYNDLNDLESNYQIEIIKESGNRRKYANKNDSFKKPRFESGDKETLALGLDAFSNIKHLSFFNKFSDVVNRLLAGNLYEGIEDEEKSRIIQIGESYNDSGYNHIEKIYHAIKNKTAIHVFYKKGAKNTTWRTISPYILKEYRNQWYMVGYSENSDRGPSSSVYALSKIESLRELDQQSYVIDPNFNADDYFKYCLGVYHDLYHPPILVKLRFCGAHHVQYLRSFKLHATMQIISSSENEIVVSIEVYNQPELKSLILGYKNEIEVLEPAELRKEIKEVLEKTLSIYQ
jgi:predicted DNA-binding transcriptional regulator YafY